MQLYNLLKKKKTGLTKKELDQIKALEEKALSSREEFPAASKELLSVLTKGKKAGAVFTNQKRFNVFPLNDAEMARRGVEGFRHIFSKYAMNYRAHPDFMDIGFRLFTNYLGASTCKKIAEEFKKYELVVHKTGNNTVANMPKDSAIYQATFNSNMRDLVLETIGRQNCNNAKSLYKQNTFAQRVHNKPDGFAEGTLFHKDGRDIQHQIHSDIFFPAVKFWYYPEATSKERGAFRFAPYSASVDLEKLNDFWYEESIKIAENSFPKWKSPGHEEGSLRMSFEELENLGWICDPVEVPADTLLIGNVNAWHHRGPAEVDSVRPAIHGSIRVKDPFAV